MSRTTLRPVATSKAEDKLRRHQAIVAYIASGPASGRSAAEIMNNAGLGHVTLRTVQRDLVDLKGAGRIDQVDGRWIAEGPRVEQELDQLLSITALGVFRSILQESLPTSLRMAVDTYLDRHALSPDNLRFVSVPEIKAPSRIVWN